MKNIKIGAPKLLFPGNTKHEITLTTNNRYIGSAISNFHLKSVINDLGSFQISDLEEFH